MNPIPLSEVQQIRERIAAGRALAAARFRDAFDAESTLPPNERWPIFLTIQAAALLETARHVRLRDGYRIAYRIDEQRTIYPHAVAFVGPSSAGPSAVPPASALAPDVALYPYFVIDPEPAALFEYWLITGEILGSPTWATTRLITTGEEYSEALGKMQQTQIVRALVVTFLPTAEWRDDGTGVLEVTVWSRAGEERIERRTLMLDRNHELQFHGRELIAEGRGGVKV
ncbi:MAG TPA: hypothetical protein VEZ11_10985 [Thermoanaerobaculia bacterium]|nr:hypothetical protein [Thermoanaerobaculia bacterium]